MARGDELVNPFRNDLLAGRIALITGGGTGLGYAMADCFASLGADVVLASRDPDHVEPAAERLAARGGRALALQVDVRDAQSVESMFAAAVHAMGGLDILVNNAAGNFLVRAEELSPNGWAAVRSIVLDGTFHCSRAAHEHLVARGGGAILNVVATYAETAGPYVVHSAAAKAGVVSLTRTMALEWARDRIRVNAISPGPVQTEGAGSRLWDSPEATEALMQGVPMARFGTTDEVATMAAFLVSEASSYCTGGVYPVDGGATLGKLLFDDRFESLLR